MSDDQQQPPAKEHEETQVLRGGKPSVEAGITNFGETLTRWLLRAGDARNGNTDHVNAGFDKNRSIKNTMGISQAFISADQAGKDIWRGDYGDMAFHGVQAATIGVTSYEPTIKPIAHWLKEAPGTKHVARMLGQAANWINTTKVANLFAVGEVVAKENPLSGIVVNTVSGGFSSAARAAQGDNNGATGEAIVTGVGVATFAFVVVAGTTANILCGPFAVACGAASMPVVLGAAFVASEVTTEITSRIYNHYAKSDIRGSSIVNIAGYAVERIPQIEHWVGDQLETVNRHLDKGLPPIAAAVVKAPIQLVQAGLKVSEHIWQANGQILQTARTAASNAWHAVDETVSKVASNAWHTVGEWMGLSSDKPAPAKPAAHPEHTDETKQRLARLHAHGKAFELAPNVLSELESHGFKAAMHKKPNEHITEADMRKLFGDLHLTVKDVDPDRDGLATPREVSKAINEGLKRQKAAAHG